MKKVLLVATLAVAGVLSAKSTIVKDVKSFMTASECNTQTSQDSDGDTVSVTCCRTTHEEAFNCAQQKLRKAVIGDCNENTTTA